MLKEMMCSFSPHGSMLIGLDFMHLGLFSMRSWVLKRLSCWHHLEPFREPA